MQMENTPVSQVDWHGAGGYEASASEISHGSVLLLLLVFFF
jgi:hypothetical protein